MNKTVSASLCFALAASSCGGGSTQLEPRFVAVHNAMSAMGMAQTGAISEGSLPEGAEARLDITLQAGQCYTFVGLGSSGVNDLDVRVVGEGDVEIGRDMTHDRQAAAQVCPERTGDYQVIVTMTEGSGGYLVSSWGGRPAMSGPRGPTRVATGGPGGPVGPGSCEEPIELTLGQPITGDTSGAQNRMQGPCAQGDAPERVYRLTLEQRAQVSVALQSAYDGALYLMSQCGDVGSMIDCNDDAGDTSHSRIDTTLEPGTYYLVVDGYGSAAGGYELIASAAPLRSIAAVCGDAQALTPGQQVSGTTEGAADYFQATCAGGARSPDRVYYVDVPSRSRLRVRQSSDHDGALYMRRTCADPTTEVACNDDFGDVRRSLVTTVVDPGRYFVFADGFSGGQAVAGNFNVTAELTPPAGGNAPGDTCQTATAANQGTFSIDTFEASDDTAGSCGGQGGADVMVRLDVRSRSQVRAVVSDAEFAGAMYIQRTCGDANSEVACTAIEASDPRTVSQTLESTLQPGQYVLVFDGARPDTFGSANVQLEMTDLRALERTCRSAPLLRPGRTVNGNTRTESDNFRATCAGNAQSNDVVYRLRIQRRSQVRIDMSSDYDGALHLRRDCIDASSELACNDDHQDNNHSRIETTLDRGTYFVIVDGFRSGSSGSYSLSVDVSR
ncbi:MAG: hypothetical protein AAGE52_13645 [Myxococcota bacterium]